MSDKVNKSIAYLSIVTMAILAANAITITKTELAQSMIASAASTQVACDCEVLEVELLVGDLDTNGDGTVNGLDEDLLADAIEMGSENDVYDLSGDGQLNTLDMLAFWTALDTVPLGGIIMYDMHRSEYDPEPDTVTVADEGLLIDYIGAYQWDGDAAYGIAADLNLDGENSIEDLALLWQYMEENGMEYVKYDIWNEEDEEPNIVSGWDEYYMIDAIDLYEMEQMYNEAADLNTDGQNTIADLALLWQYMEENGLEYVKYDIWSEDDEPKFTVSGWDENYMIDAIDLYEMEGWYNEAADLNIDGQNTTADLALLWRYMEENGLEYVKYDIWSEDDEPQFTVSGWDEYYMIDAIDLFESGINFTERADLNLDGSLDRNDFGMLWVYMENNGMEYVKYDINADGGVDESDAESMDFAISQDQEGYYNLAADLNLDGVITDADKTLLERFLECKSGR